MPFGLVNSASSFNQMMRRLIDGMKQLEFYVDDVLTHTKNWEERIEDVFDRVRKARLTLKPKKCLIGYGSVDFLGHTISNDRISPKEEAIDKIIEMPRPRTKKQIRSFLEAVNYSRNFVPECGKLMQPLTELTNKNAKTTIDWNPTFEHAFQELKSALAKTRILKLPDMNQDFILRTVP